MTKPKSFLSGPTREILIMSGQEHRTHLILQAHGTSHNYNNGQ